MEHEILKAIKEYKITAILRGIERKNLHWVIDALYDGGIRLLEVTFNQKDADTMKDTVDAIRYAKEKYQGRMHVGAGTVMTLKELELADQAGAEFILAPDVNETIIREAVKRGIACIPGAMTPSEVAIAYEAGATVVKIFPAGDMGLSYCKSIMAPINHVPMIAVGGINEKNIGDFLAIGFLGAGIGSNITNKEMIQNQDYEGIKSLAAKYMVAVNKGEN